MRLKVRCDWCGKKFLIKSNKLEKQHNKFCSHRCARVYRNLNDNPMNDDVRSALSLSRMGSGKQKTYLKINGRHAHRAIAEQLLGRPLKNGEVVHHIDGNKRNNRPENLMIFSSQAEHARWHMEKRYGDSDEV